ncbi:D-aminoacyl-tRNA deacylase [Jongsikchunia kroppenstedtii]|uniref:D-aminoacyl-tRNA deacylase n=1 Tax=Jongsikchunia kroppenstedtii TaxID=1121721 RepID=UPI0003625589|nr:D-aminoacyl-tRNA deacylase [Jongsikchunia kroppenstedtii]
MRAVVQRVTRAEVVVDGDIVGRLQLDDGAQGLVVLIGVTHDDTAAQAHTLADKIWRMRILDDERSASDVAAPILAISQFTLYANTAKGRRPSWNQAAPGTVAEPLFDEFVAALREAGATVATGRFGAHMQVDLVNDGPVTITLEI